MPPAHPFDDDKLREECGIFGVIGVTPPVPGSAFTDKEHADRICSHNVGEGFQTIEHHDSGDDDGGKVVAVIKDGDLDHFLTDANGNYERFWVSINDENANFWAGGQSSYIVP